MSGINSTKRFVINAYQNRLLKEITLKNAKKGLLTKIFTSNKKKTDSLIEILKESDDLNKLKGTQSEEEYLKKFRDAPKGGPKHSIAVNRAHHLTNFLSEYIINAFQSARFESPDIPNELNPEFDSNGFKKEKFVFEISNVELMPDLTALKISWFESDNEKINEFIETYLDKKLRNEIRNCLVNERVLNYVPKVVFVKDSSKVLMSKLEECLMKINIETNIENEKKSESEANKEQEPKKPIDNLYGINFSSILEKIKKGTNSDFTEIKSESENQLVVAQDTKFEKQLQSFEINKRIKRERLNKSTILKFNQIEFEQYRNKNLI